MTKIDFYQIESDEAPLLFSCRLVAKIYRLGHQVHIHTENEAQAKEIDALLWHFRPESFIPHTLDNLDEERLQQLTQVAWRKDVNKGEVIIKEGDPFADSYSVQEGEFQVSLVGEGHSTVIDFS